MGFTTQVFEVKHTFNDVFKKASGNTWEDAIDCLHKTRDEFKINELLTRLNENAPPALDKETIDSICALAERCLQEIRQKDDSKRFANSAAVVNIIKTLTDAIKTKTPAKTPQELEAVAVSASKKFIAELQKISS